MVSFPSARYLLRARDFADRHFDEPVTVADMARAANLSPAHFSREYRRTFGESPHQYLLTRRLERAAALLRNTDWTVARIALAVGMKSQSTFTTSFGKHFGTTPTAYRASHTPAVAAVVVPSCIVRAYGRPRYQTVQPTVRPVPPTQQDSRRRQGRRSLPSSPTQDGPATPDEPRGTPR